MANLNYQNCACYTMRFARTEVNYGKDIVQSCSCYATCYTCDQLFYSNAQVCASDNPITVEPTCICNQQCYQESSTCSCNAMKFLEERECGCYEKRYLDYDISTCTCNETCDEYQSCICDMTVYENSCRQCDKTSYDKNSPPYTCSCDTSCDNYIEPECNCNGKFQVVAKEVCEINMSLEQECGQKYSNNVCSSYIHSRYY